MYSIKELFRIGNGPSSSHTIGPKNACLEFIKHYNDCDNIDVILYGSLALTGKGHATDKIIINTLKNYKTVVKFDKSSDVPHPNTMDIIGYKDKKEYKMRFFSVGGGAIKIDGDTKRKEQIYPLTKLRYIIKYCKDNNMRLYQYVDKYEDDDIDDFIEEVYQVMMDSVTRGLEEQGTLPGPLKVERKAHYLYYQLSQEGDLSLDFRRKTVAYAYAVAEENAAGGEIVTAPTCGASGVLPAVIRTANDAIPFAKKRGINIGHKDILNAIKTAGLIGNLIKSNASISGAEAGCQAEIGAACAMAAAFQAELVGASFEQISSAAEIALEHHLGLTCDPVGGFVQIPCIERNAVAALRALDAFGLALYLKSFESKVSFDMVVETMLETGKDLPRRYRETSTGGLAKNYRC